MRVKFLSHTPAHQKALDPPKEWIMIFFSFLFFLFVLYRALILDITFDEVYTIDLATQSIRDLFLHPRNFQSANNHILNSILIKPFLFLFGKKIIAIRLPNVIASFFFFLGNRKLALTLFDKRSHQWLGFLFLSLNLYLLDFFSLSRGYGLALTFEVWSLYFFLQYWMTFETPRVAWSFLFAGLAILSNFTWINYYLPLWCTLHALFLIRKVNLKQYWKMMKWPVLISFILLLLCFTPISFLKNADEFRWGSSGWWTSMHNMVSNMLYSNREVYMECIEIILGLFVLSALTITVLYRQQLKIVEKSTADIHRIYVLLFILLFIIFSSIAQRFLLGTMYMDGRKAILYYSLLFCLILVVAKKISESIMIPTLALCAVVSVGCQLNLKLVREWYLDAHITEALHVIKQSPESMISISCSWELQTPLQFYNRYFEKEKLLLHKVEKKGEGLQDSFWFITNNDLDKLPEGYRLLQEYDNQTYLYSKSSLPFPDIR